MTNTTNNNWKVIKLNEVTEYINRGVPPVYTQDNVGTAVVNQKCIRDGQVNFNLSRLTDESTRHVPQDKLVQPYDILINSTGTGTVGRVAQIVDLAKRTTVDSHVTIVRPRKEVIDPIYLGYWMKTKQGELEALASGSTNQVELSRLKISEVNVILPPINVQKKISEIIACLDSAITKTDQIIQKNEVLKRGLMSELLSKGVGHKKFKNTKVGDIPDSWKTVKLSDVANVERGRFSIRPRNDPRFYGGDIPFIQTGDVVNSNGKIKSYSQTLNKEGLKVSKLFKKGTIVLTIAANIGDTGILEFDACFPDSLVGITPYKQLDTIYLEYFLRFRKNYLNSIATQSAQKNINLAKLNPMLISLPSLEEQKKIAEVLSSFDEKIFLENMSKKRLVILKNGLLQDIFSQKVRIN